MCNDNVIDVLVPGNSNLEDKSKDPEWHHPGSAAFNFRGDVGTSPTEAMLAAIAQCSLLDDVYRRDPTTNSLEEYLAVLTGKEAALFVLSGTMGNQLALRSLLTQPPYSILCDARSHLVNYEAGGMSSLTGALSVPVIASNGIYLTLEDILQHVKQGDGLDPHITPTRVISLENTLSGMIIPLYETRRISEYARTHDIKLHLDGARLWEVVAAGAGSLIEYCSLFDTISLCFAKGLGAPVGGILVGDEHLIRHARWVRKSIGGGLRQPGLLAAMARVAVDVTFKGGLLKHTHVIAEDFSEFWQSCGGRLKYPTQTNMIWIDLAGQSFTFEELNKKALERGILLSGERITIHYQISPLAIKLLKELVREMTNK